MGINYVGFDVEANRTFPRIGLKAESDHAVEKVGGNPPSRNN